MAPGSTQFARMPRGLPSSAVERVSETSAALAAAYEATCGVVSIAWMLETLTMALPRGRRAQACFVKKKAPSRSTCSTRSQSSAVCSSSGLKTIRPALLTTTSSREKRSTAPATVDCTSASTETSQRLPQAAGCAGLLHRLDGGSQLVGVAVGQHHARALASRAGSPSPARCRSRAGHDRHLVREASLSHGPTLLRCSPARCHRRRVAPARRAAARPPPGRRARSAGPPAPAGRRSASAARRARRDQALVGVAHRADVAVEVVEAERVDAAVRLRAGRCPSPPGR